jgi:hypothetical protein
VTSSNPTTIQSVITLAHSRTDDAVRMGTLVKKGDSGKKSIGADKKVIESEKENWW